MVLRRRPSCRPNRKGKNVGTEFRTLATGGDYFEGVRWHNGSWYASDAFRGAVLSLDRDGQSSEIMCVDALCSGLGWLPDDSMLVVSMRDRRLLRRAPDGEVTQHADFSGLSEHWINDTCVDGAGRAWVGSIGFAIVDGADPVPGDLLCADPDGTARVAASDLWCPNGIVVTADGRTLVVAETFAGRLTAFTIENDGSLTDRRTLAQFGDTPEPGGAAEMLGALELAPDGLTIDRDDHVWVADAAGRRCVRVSPDGRITDEIAAPGGANLYSCALGGADGTELLLAVAEGFFEAAQGLTGTASLVATTVDVPVGGDN
ncbi:gluconolactonase [Prauserella sp. PE36]|nr:gluconolactonase [Prauserella sp. PE36]